MQRREFVKLLGLAGLGATSSWSSNVLAAAPYTGSFFISIAAQGGWDVTSFCDPKMNVGSTIINNWASTQSIQTIGNISYAPVGNNKTFFERFYRDMLVVNGVDTLTNSHDDGVRHTWSGRIGFGYPTFGAIASAAIDPDLPLSLIHSSGHSETAGITRYTRLQNPDVIRNLANDNTVYSGSRTFELFEARELDLITQAHAARLNRQRANPSLIPRMSESLNNLFLADASRDQLKLFASNLPTQFETNADHRSAQLALLAYQSGLSIACQLGIGGFDTHQNHDVTQVAALTRLTNLVTYIFDFAEQRGFANKLVVTLSSDFGRTPRYNAGGGKDHWPIGSALLIKPGASWGNRVVGATDDGHRTLKINPATLKVDSSSSGVKLQPKHLQQAMRQLAGVDQSAVAKLFPLQAENVDMFNAAKQTV